MYHSLDSSGSAISVTSQVFEAQMTRLAELGYRVVSLRQALAEREEKGDWPDKSVVLTFYDGYASVHEHALPVLRRCGFGATVYVIPGHVDGVNDWGPPVRGFGRQEMLSWDQVRDLAEYGIEIGAHTLSHVDLSVLDTEALEREIAGSAEEIGMRLDEPVLTFAYPYGSLSDEAKVIVDRTFRAVCTTVHRRASDEPLTLLPRVEMYYFRNQRDLSPLVNGQLDGRLTLRRWARRIRRLLPV
jgi:peptidoglycan/xylan/chitin deacetylase (PgdA/CDA1 family)